MKRDKKLVKLTVDRETLRVLDEPRLQTAIGGAYPTSQRLTCTCDSVR